MLNEFTITMSEHWEMNTGSQVSINYAAEGGGTRGNM